MIEIHLFKQHAREEKALYGADASVHDLITVQGYLERRRHDLSLPTVCSRCKESAIQIAKMLGSVLEAEGMTDEAETYRWLADTHRPGPVGRLDWMTAAHLFGNAPRVCQRGSADNRVRCGHSSHSVSREPESERRHTLPQLTSRPVQQGRSSPSRRWHRL